MTEGDTGAVNLAEDRRGAGDFRHVGGFSEAHFTQALAEVSVARQKTDASGGTSGKLTQRQRLSGRGSVHKKTRR